MSEASAEFPRGSAQLMAAFRAAGYGQPRVLSHDPPNGGDARATDERGSDVKGDKAGAKRKQDDLEEDVAGDNDERAKQVIDEFDDGATRKASANEKRMQHDSPLEKGGAASVKFPLLDVEPNTVTARNVDEPALPCYRRTAKPRIDFEQLAYEAVVSRIQGHKKAYNSSSYGYLKPQYTLKSEPKPYNKCVYKLDAEALMESLAEAPFGFKKVNERLADDMKREQRTYVLTTSADHGGPSMYRRGLNQFKNKALKHYVTDPAPNEVETQTQVARDGMRLNNLDLFPSEHTRVRFKARYNQNRGAERDGTQYAAARGAGADGELTTAGTFHGAGITENVPQNSLVGYVVNPNTPTVYTQGGAGGSVYAQTPNT